MNKPKSTRKNRLARETSPYLLQHASNPVDWFAWGEEAHARAKRENKPIFLSVGYAACHWCHVMEKESFESETTAKLMNDAFINIKVDREERPDVDAIYMSAVQAMTRHGGWPMSVFLTPDLKPFYGGTYFPPEDRMGMPSFQKVLLGVANAWKTKKEDVLRSAEEFTLALKQITETFSSGETKKPGLDLLENAISHFERLFDEKFGGFGTAPKFFHVMDLRLCIRQARKGNKTAQRIFEKTLQALSQGGIYDQLGGGFHRYSTDPKWLVPHFEKMLYDNALLAEGYVEAYQLTRNTNYLQIVRETLDYIRREMEAPQGGYYATQDADTEGEEGKFYVWSKKEILETLEPESGKRFCEAYGVTEGGNWEAKNILHLEKPLTQYAEAWDWDEVKLRRWLTQSKKILFEKRAQRISPFRDEKILTSWNGLMITAMAKAFQATGEGAYLESAQKAAGFIKEKLWDPDKKQLLHCFKDGEGRFNGYLEDYAGFLVGLLNLYESDFDARWLSLAFELSDVMLDQFWDKANNSFYFTGKDHEKLIARTREYQDGATPSSSSLAITALLRLGRLGSRKDLVAVGEAALEAAYALMKNHPNASGQLLIALEGHLEAPVEVVVTDGEGKEQLLGAIRKQFLPGAVVCDANTPSHLVPMVEGKKLGEKAKVYLCKNYACQKPVETVEALEEQCQSL